MCHSLINQSYDQNHLLAMEPEDLERCEAVAATTFSLSDPPETSH